MASALVALALCTTLTNQSGQYVPDARLEHAVAPGQTLERQMHLWDDSRSLGTPLSPLFFTPATSAFESVAADLGGTPWVIERLTHALYLSLAGLGVILLMRAFRPRVGLEHAFAAFVYTFNPLTSQFLLPSTLFLYYCLAPWFAWIALRGVRDGDPWRWAAAFALAVAATGTVNGPALVYVLVPGALTALYVSLGGGYGLRRLWGWTWRAVLLSALTCSAAIVVLTLAGPEVTANLRTSELAENVARTSSWAESWRGLGFWLTYFPDASGQLPATPYFTKPVVIAATFLAPLGAVLSLALGRWRDRLLFGVMLLIGLVLMVGLHETAGPSPFGRLLSFAFNHSDFASGFRTTYKAGSGLMLAIAVLLAVGVVSLVESAGRHSLAASWQGRIPNRPWLALGVAVPTLIAVGVVIASFPFWNGHLYPETGYRTIPRYWDRTFSYLGAQRQPARVLVLPGAEDARYRWGDVHDSLFDGLSPATPLMDRALQQGTAQSADLVTAIDEYVSSPGYLPGTLAPILRRLGVRWVALQNDLDWQAMNVPRPSTYDALRTDPGLRLATTFGRRGEYTTGGPNDLGAALLAESVLPPVELYEVRGRPSPRQRLAAGPPLLVAGGGDSWPSLAAAGLLDGPPVAYTGAAGDQVLSQFVDSGSQVVVTDGNRRRATQSGLGRRSFSPTLASSESSDQILDLFRRGGSQSVATYADAVRIFASRYAFPLSPFEAPSRPANAFDRVARTAWRVRGALDPDGEWIAATLRHPETVTGVSVLPHADGPWSVRTVDVILHTEVGGETIKRLNFDETVPQRNRVPIRAAGVNEIELRIARVDGPGAVGIAGVGIAEVGVTTPTGPLDLREFVRTPGDLAGRAARDGRLQAKLAARPPRYELRRVIGVGGDEEETEIRREITTFGSNRYHLSARVRINGSSADSALDGLLGASVGAVGTSRYGGDLNGRGDLVVDDDLSTGWEPNPRPGERVDLHFPATTVRTVEVLVVSGPIGGVARSRLTKVDVAVDGKGTNPAPSVLPPAKRCGRGESPPGGCLERHVVHVPATVTDRLSVTLEGIKQLRTRLGPEPPRVAEVRINGGDWSALANPAARDSCRPLFAVDGRPIPVRLPRTPNELLAGKLLKLHACESIRLGPGLHRIETLPGLSGAVLTSSLTALGEKPAQYTPPRGEVALVDRSPTQLDLQVKALSGALLIGGMPSHPGWAAQGDNLRREPLPLDTFAAWRVEAPTAGKVTLSFNPQRIYELAMALSIASVAWCLWRVTRRRGMRL